MTDSDYADGSAHLTDTLYQAENLLHSLEQSTGDIGLYVNTNKQSFKYFACNFSSTESNVSISITKARADSLSIM